MTPIVFMRAALVAALSMSAATVLQGHRLVMPRGHASVWQSRRQFKLRIVRQVESEAPNASEKTAICDRVRFLRAGK